MDPDKDRLWLEAGNLGIWLRLSVPVGVGVLDDPSEKLDLDGLIFPHLYSDTAFGGGDVEDAVPYKNGRV